MSFCLLRFCPHVDVEIPSRDSGQVSSCLVSFCLVSFCLLRFCPHVDVEIPSRASGHVSSVNTLCRFVFLMTLTLCFKWCIIVLVESKMEEVLQQKLNT